MLTAQDLSQLWPPTCRTLNIKTTFFSFFRKHIPGSLNCSSQCGFKASLCSSQHPLPYPRPHTHTDSMLKVAPENHTQHSKCDLSTLRRMLVIHPLEDLREVILTVDYLKDLQSILLSHQSNFILGLLKVDIFETQLLNTFNNHFHKTELNLVPSFLVGTTINISHMIFIFILLQKVFFTSTQDTVTREFQLQNSEKNIQDIVQNNHFSEPIRKLSL